MARRNRCDLIDESTVGTYCVSSRTVRRAFLMGVDPQTGRDYGYRKEQLERRLATLCGVFAVECLDYDVLENHVQAILRNRPDIVAEWSDQEVARRWLLLERSALELKEEPSADEIAEFLASAERLAQVRQGLSSISEFMGHWKEPIARVANFVEHCTGSFWQGRFKSERLRDEAELVACSLFVSLNPMLAGLTPTPEESAHTSFHARTLDEAANDDGGERRCSGWMPPLSVNGDGYDGAASQRRASNRGYLHMSFDEYCDLLAAVAEHERSRPSSRADGAYRPAIKRLGISPARWEETLQVMSCRFARERSIMQRMFAEAGRVT